MGNKNYNFKDEIKIQINASIETKEKIIDKNIEVINKVANVIINAYKNNKKVLWCGNGGSAADSQHLACELVSKFCIDRKPLRSIALTTNTSILSAISNDYNFDKIFERQVDALADEKDILIGLTTSGTSKNIINALNAGKKKGLVTIAMTGAFIDNIEKYADHIISVPSEDTPHIQEGHIMIGHIICYLVEKTLFGGGSWGKKRYSSIETVQ